MIVVFYKNFGYVHALHEVSIARISTVVKSPYILDYRNNSKN